MFLSGRPIMTLALPVNTVDDFLALDKFLVKEENYYSLVKHMRSFEGSTVGKTVQCIMRGLMTSQVAEQFSWLGSYTKAVMRGRNVLDALCSAVRLMSNFEDASICEIEDSVRSWLDEA